MKRFAKAYLTIVIVIVVLANLVLIILYGQHFIFQGADNCASTDLNCSSGFNQGVLGTQLVIVNSIVFVFFGLVWMLLRHLQSLWDN